MGHVVGEEVRKTNRIMVIGLVNTMEPDTVEIHQLDRGKLRFTWRTGDLSNR